MKIVWSKTGDEVELEVLNRDLFYYWYDKAGSQLYSSKSDLIADISIISKDLATYVTKVNDLLSKSGRQLPVTESVIWSQAHLNLLHKRWVEIQQEVPGIKTFFELAKAGSSKDFEHINDLIHAIEHRTKFPFWAENYKEIDNPFIDRIEEMTNQQGHLFLSYKNLGRTCWQKYVNGEHTFSDSDTNNWDVLGNDIVFDLSPIIPQVLPEEYRALCRQHQVPAVGLELPIAKFKEPKWDRLKTIFRRNILSNNYFVFDVDN